MTSKEDDKLILLYPFCLFILERFQIDKRLDPNKKVKENLTLLNLNKDMLIVNKIYWCKKIAIMLVIVFGFNILSLVKTIDVSSNNLIKGRYIERPSYGEGDKIVDLNVTLKHIDNKFIEDNIKLNIIERRYKKNEIEEIMNKAREYIDANILEDNQSAEAIESPLNLIKTIPNTGLTIDWKLDDTGIINKNGQINDIKIKEGGELISLTAEIQYFEETTYYEFFLKIMPIKKSKEEVIIEKLKEEIDNSTTYNLNNEKVELPDKINDYQLYFSERKEKTDIALLFMGILFATIIFFAMDYDLEKKIIKKNSQMLMDYPEIIDKITLLLGAGMTIKGAWERIATEYNQKLERLLNNKKVKINKKYEDHKRYAYEEILITWHELQNGESEAKVYERFGRRTKLLPYLKFSSLIAQNLQKGSNGLLELLKFEAIEAFEDRKQMAKRLGEEAGTKLLGPMMIMLAVVLFIIIVPAFLSMGL